MIQNLKIEMLTEGSISILKIGKNLRLDFVLKKTGQTAFIMEYAVNIRILKHHKILLN
jgi:hypothetical protein